MARKQNQTYGLPPLVNGDGMSLVPSNKLKLTPAQAHEITRSYIEQAQPQPPTLRPEAPIEQDPIQVAKTLAQYLGTQDYKNPNYQFNPLLEQRANDIMNVIGGKDLQQLQTMQQQGLQQQRFNQGLDMLFKTGNKFSQQPTEMANMQALVDYLTKQRESVNEIETERRNRAQAEALGESTNIPSMYLENSKEALANILSPYMKGQQQMELAKQYGENNRILAGINIEGRKDVQSDKFAQQEELPSTKLENQLTEAKTAKILEELKNPKKGGASFSQVTQARKEFESMPEIKNFGELRRQTANVNDVYKAYRSGKQNANMADQAIVTSLNKMLDPTSVVRESEFARTAQGQSLLNTGLGYAQKLTKGGSGLTNEERADAVRLVNNLYNASVPVVNNRVKDYVGLAQRNDINPKDIIPNDYLAGFKGVGSAKATKPVVKAPAVGTVKSGYKFLGGNPSIKSNWRKI